MNRLLREKWGRTLIAVVSLTLVCAVTGTNPLTIELTDTISLIEVAYTLGGTIALVFALIWTWRAQRDRDGLVVTNTNGGRLIATRINLTVGYGIAVKAMIYIVLGLTAMTTAGAGYVTVQSIVFALALIFAQVVSIFMMVHITTLHELLIRHYDALARQKRADDAAQGLTA